MAEPQLLWEAALDRFDGFAPVSVHVKKYPSEELRLELDEAQAELSGLPRYGEEFRLPVIAEKSLAVREIGRGIEGEVRVSFQWRQLQREPRWRQAFCDGPRPSQRCPSVAQDIGLQ